MVEQLMCTLIPRETADRVADYGSLGRDALLSVDREERRAVLRFRPDPATRERVDALVAAESRCCAFLDYRVDERPDALVLAITAPAGGELMMHMLVDALAVTEA